MDDKYVADYAFTPGALSRNQTFTIDLDTAFSLYKTDECFREQISTGKYQYIDGHFCQVDKKFLYHRGGDLRMTSYALSHMDECCIVFDVLRAGTIPIYQEGTLQKGTEKAETLAGYAPEQPAKFDFLAESQRISEILYSLPMSPSGTLKAHMQARGVTVEGLVAKSGVSESTIKRLRSDNGFHPSKVNALAICVGLHLEPPLRRDWLSKAGIILTASPTDMLYELLMDSMYCQPISVINQILEGYGIPPLCRTSDELD